MTHYLIDTKVAKLERKTRARHAVINGRDPNTGSNIYVIEKDDIGWFVLLENSHEWLFLGFEEPKLKIGQPVTIRLEPK